MSKKVAAVALFALTGSMANLAKAVKVEPKKDETYPAFAQRTCEEVGKLEDDQFDKLAKADQKFFNDTVAAINEEKPLPGAPKDVEPAAATEPAAAPAPAKAKGKGGKPGPTETKPAAPKEDKAATSKKGVKVKRARAVPASANEGIKAKGKKAKAAKSATKAKAKATAKPRSASTAAQVRAAVIAAPKATLEKIMEKVGIKEVDPNVSLVYTETQAVLALKDDAKARKEALAEGTSGDKIRAVVAGDSKLALDFEAVVKAAGLPKKDAKAGGYLQNRFRGSRAVMQALQ